MEREWVPAFAGRTQNIVDPVSRTGRHSFLTSLLSQSFLSYKKNEMNQYKIVPCLRRDEGRIFPKSKLGGL